MKIKAKTKNNLLKCITLVAGILYSLSVSALDSETLVPLLVFIACLAWFGVFAYANS